MRNKAIDKRGRKKKYNKQRERKNIEIQNYIKREKEKQRKALESKKRQEEEKVRAKEVTKLMPVSPYDK